MIRRKFIFVYCIWISAYVDADRERAGTFDACCECAGGKSHRLKPVPLTAY